ncbi:MAG TPA: ABC transporter ATP-binding protein [Nitrospirales bacterium]|nr:ABC transporter ATP-binding protein [Nitrospirales bacterium]
MEITRGEVLAIVGASGVGKSTLLHTLGALDRPTSGTVEFNGEYIFNQSDNQLAHFRNKNIGFVFQFHHLLPEFTAVENVRLPGLIMGDSTEAATSRAIEALKDFGLGHRLSHRPGELSGGEQQRVAIARAVLNNPALVLADEPTGNLDTQTGQDVFQLLRALNQNKGTTFVLVTHNEALAARANRVLRMVDGRFEHG